ncbi:MFS transporter [Streptomyces sp. SID13726]|uniref:MFS transporter n=1 Tax=Streptomyces sp. SID13726 TaxID=2706058 RepID=UPI0013B64CE6|nr:MFS transporter [Streptomyces sp. SID13726]NEB03498.1 aromatic acid/H+ symport family MFS transporter [Streptomyces sp. SID13726]
MSTPSRGRLHVVAACFLILLCEGYDLAMFGSIVPSLRSYGAWHLSAETIGLMGSASVLGMLCGAAGAAWLADRFGRRPLMIGAVVLFSLAMGAGAVAPSAAIFLVLRFLVGLGAGAVMPTAAATLLDVAPAGKGSRFSAMGFVGVGLGGVVAGLLSLWLVPSYGFRAMCAAGLAPLLLIPYLLRVVPESIPFLLARGRAEEAASVAARLGVDLAEQEREEERRDAVRPASRGRLGEVFGEGRAVGTVIFWGATLFCLLVTFGVSAWLPDLLLGAGYSMSVSLGSLVALKAGAVGVLAAGWLADRFGQKRVVLCTYLCSAFSLAALSLSPPPVVAYALIALLGLGTTGLQTLINAYVGSYYPTRIRATGLGLNLSIGRIGGIVGPTYLGFLVASGLGFGGKFYALAVPALVGACLIAAVPRPRPAPRVVAPADAADRVVGSAN